MLIFKRNMLKTQGRRSLAREAGFSLLEAMIALVIIMIGLLGVAGLQALGIRSGAQAHLRSMAALNAHSLAASMRANRVYWTQSTTPATISIKASAAGTVTLAPAVATAACQSLPCSPEQVAGYNLNLWGKQLVAMKHGAQATITRIANAGTSASAYKVTVQWSERHRTGQGVTTAPAAGTVLSTSVLVQP